MSYQSPGGDVGKVFEQLGYLKAEIDARPRHEDLKDLFHKVDVTIRDQISELRVMMMTQSDENRRLKADLDKFRNGGLMEQIQKTIDKRDLERDAERQRVIGEVIKQHRVPVILFLLVLATLHPDIRSAISTVFQFFFG